MQLTVINCPLVNGRQLTENHIAAKQKLRTELYPQQRDLHVTNKLCHKEWPDNPQSFVQVNFRIDFLKKKNLFICMNHLLPLLISKAQLRSKCVRFCLVKWIQLVFTQLKFKRKETTVAFFPWQRLQIFAEVFTL